MSGKMKLFIVVDIIVTLLLIYGAYRYVNRENVAPLANLSNETMQLKTDETPSLKEPMSISSDGTIAPTGSVLLENPEDKPSAELPNIKNLSKNKVSYKGAVLAGSASPLLDYNQTDYEQALQSDKLIVLYFYASWCPICKEETTSGLYPAFNELKDTNVVGFRVNFNDTDTDENEKNLAREHGVAYQHTKVLVRRGKRILKSPESWDRERYAQEIRNASSN